VWGPFRGSACNKIISVIDAILRQLDLSGSDTNCASNSRQALLAAPQLQHRSLALGGKGRARGSLQTGQPTVSC
jgi:hypothetical protein